jgi:hypothetical protein
MKVFILMEVFLLEVKLFGVPVTFNKLPALNLSGSALLLGAPFFTKFVDMDKHKNINVKRQRGT